MPHDELAWQLSEQTFLLPDFLHRHAPQAGLPRLHRRALLHAHCHHKAVFGLDPEESLLTDMGIELEVPATGCCGMAGAFGFEQGDHYDLSVACGERVLLPEARRAAADTLIIADGFSCREQIAQCTQREAWHVADLLQLAWRVTGDDE
ncbi:MAG TPA: hypothetical protein VFM14_11980 [Gemmatimonadales bacterium]|nr:hypothetical protein [Gemmatimonadales bacterium]